MSGLGLDGFLKGIVAATVSFELSDYPEFMTNGFMLSGHQQDLPRPGLGQVVEQELVLWKTLTFLMYGITCD